MFILAFSLFIALKFLLDKKKFVCYLEVFWQNVWVNFTVNWHLNNFQLLSLHNLSIWWGGVLPPGVATRKWRPPRAHKRHLVTDSCHVANVYRPLGLKKQDSCTKCWTKTNGQRYRELQLIWHLVSWLSDAYDWRKHCRIPFKKKSHEMSLWKSHSFVI